MERIQEENWENKKKAMKEHDDRNATGWDSRLHE
jgi:hypothetical protein